MKKNKVILPCLIVAGTIVLTGCGNNDNHNVTPNQEVKTSTSGNKEVVFYDDQPTFGNGTSIVSYKGNVYFIEFGGNDFTSEAYREPVYYNTNDANTQRYVNVMDSRGDIKNLFRVTGTTALNIIDNRFYLQSSNGLLYTVDMNGENSLELTRGEYLAFDEDNHFVYYQNNNNPNIIYKMNTQDLSISQVRFNNPLTSNNYNFLTAKGDYLYYSLLDKRSKELILIEYNLKENTQEDVASLPISLHESDYNLSEVSDFVDCIINLGKYCGICVGTPTEGTMGGFYDEEIYIFDLEQKTISKAPRGDRKEGDWFSSYDLYNMVFAELYKLNNDGAELPDMSTLVSDVDKEIFARKYGIDIDEELGEEAKNSSSFEEEDEKYIVDVEDYTIIGKNVFYKLTISRRNPTNEIGWRSAFVRMYTEVYVKNLNTNETKYIYSYVNNNYNKIEDKIKELLNSEEKISGDISDIIEGSGESYTEPLKNGEMYIEISTAGIWKEEFDVTVEEVGGMIIGKRIEYEGHHRKDEGTIKVKVNKEVGAMLTVYIDGETSSQMRIE